MADRAAENGVPSSTVRHSSAQVPASGTLGSAMSSTSPPRTRSRVIMTWRRGNESIRPASSGPPRIGGR